jgi:hypothetical protein
MIFSPPMSLLFLPLLPPCRRYRRRYGDAAITRRYAPLLMLMILFDADAAAFDAADILPMPCLRCRRKRCRLRRHCAFFAADTPLFAIAAITDFSFRQRQLYALIFSLFAAMPIDTPLSATRFR